MPRASLCDERAVSDSQVQIIAGAEVISQTRQRTTFAPTIAAKLSVQPIQLVQEREVSAERLLTQLEAWREDLINLSHTNRLLYFRKTKSSTLELRLPGASELLARLSNVRPLTFWEPPEDLLWDHQNNVSEVSGDLVKNPETPDVLRRRTARRGPARLTPRPDEIVCDITAREALLKTLRWLQRRAAQEFMDKGLWILYLGIGFVDWIDQPRETGEPEKVSSPIVLIPVQLRRDTAQAPYQLFRVDEDPSINPALAFKLQHDFGITLPAYDDDDEADIHTVLESVRDGVSDQDGWSVRDSVVLSLFSFHKEVMYRDLLNNEGAVAAHPLVRALALGHRAEPGLLFDPTPEADLDEQYPPESLTAILDCDASQRQCLVAAAAGHSFVMEGPPGTGKSQTIANLIAHGLANDKSILFVSEKAAALEVVQNRLDAAGLSEYVLALHSHKATRKEVAQALGRSLTTRLAPRKGMAASEMERLRSQRRELSAYASAMNERRQPIGRSVHDVIGEISQYQQLAQAPVSESIGTDLTAERFANIRSAAEALARAWGPVERGDDFLWRSLVDGNLTQRRRSSLLALLEGMRRLLQDIEEHAHALCEDAGLLWRDGVPDSERWLVVLNVLAAPRAIPIHWLCMDSLAPVIERAADVAETVANIRQLSTDLATAVGSLWRDLNYEDLQFLEAHQNHEDIDIQVSAVTAAALVNSLRALAFLLRRGDAGGAELANALELARPQTVSEIGGLIDLAALARTTHRPSAEWLDIARLPEICAGVDVLQPRVEEVKSATAAVESVFDLAILDVDVEALRVRFREVHHGLGKLRFAYWRDRSVIKRFSKSGKVRTAEMDALSVVAECQTAKRELRLSEARHAEAIGQEYYRSLETDFGELRAALTAARHIVERAAGRFSPNALARRFSTKGDLVADVARMVSSLTGWYGDVATVVAAIGQRLWKSCEVRTISDLLSAVDIYASEMQRVSEILSAIGKLAAKGDVPIADAIDWLRKRASIALLEHEVDQARAVDEAALGRNYRGLATDFDALREDLRWADALRKATGASVSLESAEQILNLDCGARSLLNDKLEGWSKLKEALLQEFTSTHQPLIHAELITPFGDVESFLSALSNSIEDISEWGAHAAAAEALCVTGLSAAVEFCCGERISADQVVRVLLRSALESWLDATRASDARLGMFLAKNRDQIAQTFKDLDRHAVLAASAVVIERCNAKRPTLGAGAAAIIAAEANKQRRHMPIRRLIDQTAPVVQALKPCLMMSPLSVSQFLPASMTFDMVIFDEASQVRPADAINCIYRGKQLVVAGDQKQLPPTPFFEKFESDSGDEWEEEQLEEFESVMDIAKGSGAIRPIGLRWHYRSQHEDLITYSNYSFYDGQLVTFPSSNISAPDVGVELFTVAGVYRRGGARDNPIEAAKVVERVLFHLRAHPHLSIGVVAFSEAQANTIENEILQASQESPELRVMLDGDRLHGGFVKNLETVQGDERDIIIFSIGYGKDEAGRFTLQFGPINKVGGQRRLNVAITRARRRVEVVSSVTASDFVGDVRSDGVRHLRRYLQFAGTPENRLSTLAVDVAPEGRDSESPFEEEVARVMRSWGFDVVPQVGCADYRIDLAVKHPNEPGKYALGVECDGAMYHSSKVARDRDRLRQEVLSRLGWTNLHRIWGLSWYWNRGNEELRLRRAIEQAIGDQPNVEPVGPPGIDVGPEQISVELDEKPSWAVPYRVAVPVGPRTTAAMHEGAAQAELQRVILDVVTGEGPIATELTLQRVRECWGMNRAGSRARGAFDAALRSLRRRGFVVGGEGFLALPSQTNSVVRSADASDPATIRTIHEIPPSELNEAVIRFVREVHAISEDELTVRIAAVFGWSRRGSDIAAEFRRTLRKLISNGVLVRREDDFLVAGPDSVKR